MPCPARVPPIRILLSLAIAATICSGCAAVDERMISTGVYDLATPASGFLNNDDRARVILDARSRMLCRSGYTLQSERAIEDRAGRRTMMRRIACRGP
jgi:hypothetical protein